MFKLFKTFKLLKSAFGAYKFHILLLAAIGLLSGILEGIGANALIPLFSFITGDSVEGADFITRAIERVFLFLHIDFSLKFLLIFISLLFIGKAFLLFAAAYVQVSITANYERNVRRELLGKFLRAEWSYLLGQKIGHLEKTLSIEVKISSALLRSITGMILVISGILMYALVAVNISLPITLFTLAFGALLLFAFKPLIKLVKRNSAATVAANRSVAHFINENVVGIKTIKAASVSKHVRKRGDRLFETLKKLKVRSELLGSIPANFIQPIGIVFILAVFSFSYKATDFNLPAFAAVVYLMQRIFTYAQQLQSQLNRAYSQIPYLKSVLAHQSREIFPEEKDGGRKPFAFRSKIMFKDVSFAYDKKVPVLKKTNFELKRGEFAGLIGASGSGKTTIVDVLLRLFKPDEGGVFIDGVPAREFSLREWRRKIGYVSQDIFLANDTLGNNIKFYDPLVTDEDVARSSKTAYIHDMVKRLPKGFDTVVGERGVMLSAGQRQRVIIARALARSPELLILDEATSALDNESEKYIQEAIENLKGKMTVLVIAHRLGTVMNCDRLLVLDGGRIIERGAPNDLLADRRSYFYKIYNIRS